VAGSLRLDLAQYREMQAFAQFGSDLDAATQRMLARGSRLVEVLKQDQYVPQEVVRQVLIIYAATKGHLDDVAPSAVRRFEAELHGFVTNSHADVYTLLRDKKELTDDVKAKLDAVITEFKKIFA
jgi:F-type H+-transporting ATPase subunit alpha